MKPKIKTTIGVAGAVLAVISLSGFLIFQKYSAKQDTYPLNANSNSARNQGFLPEIKSSSNQNANTLENSSQNSSNSNNSNNQNNASLEQPANPNSTTDDQTSSSSNYSQIKGGNFERE